MKIWKTNKTLKPKDFEYMSKEDVESNIEIFENVVDRICKRFNCKGKFSSFSTDLCDEYLFKAYLDFTIKIKTPGFDKEIKKEIECKVSNKDFFTINYIEKYFAFFEEDTVFNRIEEVLEKKIENAENRVREVKAIKKMYNKGMISEIDPTCYTIDELEYLSK